MVPLDDNQLATVIGGKNASDPCTVMFDRADYIQDGAQAGTVSLAEINEYNAAFASCRAQPQRAHDMLVRRQLLPESGSLPNF
jgi:hypothetical protein